MHARPDHPLKLWSAVLIVLPLLTGLGCQGILEGTTRDGATLSVNLVQDPSFESQTVARKLTGPWAVDSTGTPAEVGTDLKGYSHSGDKSAFIYAAAPTGAVWTAITQTVTVPANSHLTLTGWITSASVPLGKIGAVTTSGKALGETQFGELNGYTQETVEFDSGNETRVTIYIGYASQAGQPSSFNVDDVTLNAPQAAASRTRYEAEDADTNLPTETRWPGSSGDSYLCCWAVGGQAATFHVNVNSAGNYSLAFGYSAGSGEVVRAISVNGQVLEATHPFPATSDWNHWITTSLVAALKAGGNTVTVAYSSGVPTNEYLNLDYLDVTSSSSTPVAPAPTPTPDPTPIPTPTPQPTGAVALDCANSSQPEICNHVNGAAVPLSAPASLSTACQSPRSVVQVNPSNLMSAVNGAQAGQTLLFEQGNYSVPSTLSLVSGVNYCGEGGDASKVVLNGSNLGYLFSGGDVANVTFDGITLNGSGFTANSYTHFYLQNSTVENIKGRGWPVDQAILVPHATDFHVVRNYFRNNDIGIQAYELHSIVIADNSFSAVDEGMHLLFQGADDDIRVARNRFVEGRRIMIELQGNQPFGPLTHLVVEDNVIVFPYRGGYADSYGMGISAAIPGIAQAPIIRNNWLFGPVGNYQTLGVLAIEAMGNDDVFSGNVMQYWNWGFSISGNGPSIQIRDNIACETLNLFGADGGFNGWPVESNNVCKRDAQGYATR